MTVRKYRALRLMTRGGGRAKLRRLVRHRRARRG